MKKTKKRSAVSWVIEFAGQKKPNYTSLYCKTKRNMVK